jgi:hypothetical protein
MSGGVTLTSVQGWDYWRVKMAWPDSTPRYFGKFPSKAEAEKWIAEHHVAISRKPHRHSSAIALE